MDNHSSQKRKSSEERFNRNHEIPNMKRPKSPAKRISTKKDFDEMIASLDELLVDKAIETKQISRNNVLESTLGEKHNDTSKVLTYRDKNQIKVALPATKVHESLQKSSDSSVTESMSAQSSISAEEALKSNLQTDRPLDGRLDSNSLKNNIPHKGNVPSFILNEREYGEIEKSRIARQKYLNEKQEADKRELEMIAESREKRAAMERERNLDTKKAATDFILVSKYLPNESILELDYLNAVIECLSDDKTISPIPSDFYNAESYNDWNATMNQNLQNVVIDLITYRFISPPKPAPIGGDLIQIRLHVIEAQGIVSKAGRMRHTYCKISYGEPGAKKKKLLRFETDSISSLNPYWDQFVTIKVTSLSDVIVLEVADKLKDHFLGKTVLYIHEIVSEAAKGGIFDNWFNLEGSEGRTKNLYVGGEIHVRASIVQDIENNTSNSYLKIQNSLDSLQLDFRALYDTLMRACVTLDIYSKQGRNEILSQESAVLLRCWAKSWRISDFYQLISHVKILFEAFSKDIVNVFDILRVFHCIYTSVKQNDGLNPEEHTLILNQCQIMRDKFCEITIKYKELFPENQPAKALESTVLLLRMIHKFPGFLEKHPELSKSPKDELRNILTEAVITKFQRYKELTEPLDESDAESVIDAINKLAELINNDIELDARYFQSAFNQELDIVRLTAESMLKYFVLELESRSEVLSTDAAVEKADMHVFELYKTIRIMSSRLTSMSISYVEGWFTPFMRKWLKQLAKKTFGWVNHAIDADNFKPITKNNTIVSHSSSIADIFSAIYAQLEFISNLKWSEPVENAEFLLSFTQTVYHAIDNYCNALTNPEEKKAIVAPPNVSQFANLLAKNREQLPGDIPEVYFVKLQNIEFALKKLQEMYRVMNVSKIDRTIRENKQQSDSNSKESRNSKLQGQFSIHILYAENLKGANKNGLSNPFVIIRLPEGTKVPPLEKISRIDVPSKKVPEIVPEVILKGEACELVHTRYVADTLNPIWEESFSVVLPPVDRLEVACIHKNFLSADVILGTTYIDLNSLKKRIIDNHAQDIVVELEPQGRLSMRLVMAGDKEDVNYWFKRTIERLERSRSSFLRKMTANIDSFVNEIFDSAIKAEEAAQNSTTSFFKQLTGGEANNSNVTSAGYSINTAVDDSFAVGAISPLIEFLEKNFTSICNQMEISMIGNLIKKLWRDIISISVSKVVPPLFGVFSQKKLNFRQITLVTKIVDILREFFHGDGGEFGLDFQTLDSKEYLDLQELLKFSVLDTVKVKFEYSKSLREGKDKELLLRLLRFEGESDIQWFNTQLLHRKEKALRK